MASKGDVASCPHLEFLKFFCCVSETWRAWAAADAGNLSTTAAFPHFLLHNLDEPDNLFSFFGRKKKGKKCAKWSSYRFLCLKHIIENT